MTPTTPARPDAPATTVDTVVLDLDGTLVDSVYVHVLAWRAAFAAVGLDVASHRLHRAIGLGGDRLVAHVAGDAAERAVGDRVRALHDEDVERRTGEIGATDGAAALLEALRGRGLQVVLASSGAKEQTEQLLDLVEGSHHLLHEKVAGADAEASKPAPDLLEIALESVEATRAVTVGDAVWDVEASRAAGVPCLGLRCGGIGTAELLEAGAVAVYDDPRDLVDHLDEALALAAEAHRG